MLKLGSLYHIYNRGNNREKLFRSKKCYQYFLKLCRRHILPVAEIQAWCLLPNHYHFLALIRTEEEQYKYYRQGLKETEVATQFKRRNASRGFANAFSTYAMAINRTYNRTGSLFQDRFKRKEVCHPGYQTHLINYIHFNPAKHRIVAEAMDYPWSSIAAYLEGQVDPVLGCKPRQVFDSGRDYVEQFSKFTRNEFYSSDKPEKLIKLWEAA